MLDFFYYYLSGSSDSSRPEMEPFWRNNNTHRSLDQMSSDEEEEYGELSKLGV